MIDFDQITGLDWDAGNGRKSVDKHDVSQAEAESIFFNDPLIVAEDAKHSSRERRFNALGNRFLPSKARQRSESFGKRVTPRITSTGARPNARAFKTSSLRRLRYPFVCL